MKTNLFKFGGIILLSMSFIACNSSNQSSSIGEVSSSSSFESTSQNDYYSVTIYNPDGTRSKDNITVLWCTEENCLTPVTADDNGVAKKDVPPRDYYVHLEGVPSQYTYDPNGYIATADNRHIDVQLYNLSTPNKGKGQEYNRYMINEGEFYKVNVTKNDEIIYYGFNPKLPGKYKIESFATTILSMDKADPAVGYYGTNQHYIPSIPEKEDDNSKDGINFSLEFEIGMDGFIKTDAVDENGDLIPQRDNNGDLVSGWSFTFGVITSSDTGTCSYDIKITRTGDFIESEKEKIETIHATTPIADADDPAQNEQFTRGTLLEGSDKAVFNEEDGFYHLNSADGKLIYAKLSSPIEFFETPISELSASIGKDVLLVDEKTDYLQFVLEYSEHCNSDGAYPVNEEIKVFLDRLQLANGYFYGQNGLVSGAVPNYVKGNEWLFACGYYLEVGTQDNPIIITELGILTVSLKENQVIYYNFVLDNYVEIYSSITISSTNAFAKLVDKDNNVYTSDSAGFTYVVALTNNVTIPFSISYSDGHPGNIGIRIVINEA